MQELLRQVTTLSRYNDSSDGESEPESRRHVKPLPYVRVILSYRILALQSTVRHLTFHKHLLEEEEALLQSFASRRQMLERVLLNKSIFRDTVPQSANENYFLGYVVLHAVFIRPATAEVFTAVDPVTQEAAGRSAQLAPVGTTRRAAEGRRRGQRQPTEVIYHRR